MYNAEEKRDLRTIRNTEYEIVDSKSGQAVTNRKGLIRATNEAERRNQRYGASRYYIHQVEEHVVIY